MRNVFALFLLELLVLVLLYRYVTADAVSNWSNVVSVKAQVLLATVRDYVATSSQSYTFDGTTTTPTDRKIRTAVSSVITLRNRVP